VAFEPQGFESLPRRHWMNPLSLEGFREFLQDRRLAESTIDAKIKLVKHLAKHNNLWDSEAVTKFITRAKWGGRRKNNAGYAYMDWCNWKGFEYEFTRFREKTQPLPYIPTERELDQLIAGFGRKYSCFLQLLKETGFRPIEACSLTPDDIDIEKRLVTLNSPAKNSRPRQFRISNQLTAMITPLIHRTEVSQQIWSAKPSSIRSIFCRKRKFVAEKLGNPKLVKISMKTFRHWKATVEYHRTKDILYVQNLLGHKNIKNTLVYTHLVNFDNENIYVVKVAKTLKEFTDFLEKGFEFVSNYNEHKICRKRV
jgi:integrase